MIARRDLWDEVEALLRANRRPNLVEEALRYRSLLDLSTLPTDQLMALAARMAAEPAPVAAEPRSFVGRAAFRPLRIGLDEPFAG